MENEQSFCVDNFLINFQSAFELTDEVQLKIKKYFEASCLVLKLFLEEEVLKAPQEKQFEVNVNVCDDETIQELNKTYRNKDKTTDVLSFPVHEDFRNTGNELFEPEVCLGDIYINYYVAQEQAKKFDLSFEEEFLHLFVHGVLHLCGYDHEISVAEEEKMQNFESEIMKRIALELSKNQ